MIIGRGLSPRQGSERGRGSEGMVEWGKSDEHLEQGQQAAKSRSLSDLPVRGYLSHAVSPLERDLSRVIRYIPSSSLGLCQPRERPE